jgi:hypothetical protein
LNPNQAYSFYDLLTIAYEIDLEKVQIKKELDSDLDDLLSIKHEK